jgi:hypothetical protein
MLDTYVQLGVAEQTPTCPSAGLPWAEQPGVIGDNLYPNVRGIGRAAREGRR